MNLQIPRFDALMNQRPLLPISLQALPKLLDCFFAGHKAAGCTAAFLVHLLRRCCPCASNSIAAGHGSAVGLSAPLHLLDLKPLCSAKLLDAQLLLLCGPCWTNMSSLIGRVVCCCCGPPSCCVGPLHLHSRWQLL
ncbi:hypothetical protein VIGAN_11168900 [Vigna angularis var. angularis]|uniref:Uncharacterized protein n=1 Tax=Vigna angularis var. angularis TaxID=157739 RepID=A0A0S3TAG7_PHAAN|nr:hypothetical protein VIGAN_11168900 [Vigna angularis var. angularis]